MQARVVEFIGLCRSNGLRVSTAETLDALSALTIVGFADPDVTRSALLATLCKRDRDSEIFEELFDLFFFRPGHFLGQHDPDKTDGSPLVLALRGAGMSEEDIERVLALIADEASRLSPVARAGLGLRRIELGALLRLAGASINLDRLVNPLQVGFFTQQLMDTLNLRGAEDELASLVGRLERPLGKERAGEVRKQIDAALAQLRRGLRAHVEEQFRQRNVRFLEKFRADTLATKPFSTMSEAELLRLRDEVRRLGRRFRDRLAARRRPRRRGRLDARRTIRAALSSGGVPFSLKYRNRRPERPALVVLCDISDSVRHVARFMLELAFTLQQEFSRVRSFVFVSDLAECTQLFSDHELGRAVDLVSSGAAVSVFANSNYGRAFGQFAARHLDAVTSRTTVVVIGDGRNNYNPPEAWALEEIAKRAKRVVWLNPESAASWAFGDSVMREYEKHCDHVAEVSNLATLAEALQAWGM